MNTELLNKISKLAFYGFYDPSKNIITVHFFNEQENKSDVIAYLLNDMSWDVREITNETSTLHNDHESITIFHNCLGLEKINSQFDTFVRLGLEKMAKEVHGEDADLTKIDIMFEIFKKNEY